MANTVQRYDFFVPEQPDVVQILEKELGKMFKNASVKFVQCPDLTKLPYGLAAPGISGNTKIIQAGGVKNLLPLPKKENKYSIQHIVDTIGINSALCIGAGAGPFYEIGQNSEMMANIKFSGGSYTNLGFTSKTVGDDSSISHVLEKHKTTSFGLLGDFFVSDGEPGQVIEVAAKGRTGSHDLITSIHSILSSTWKDKSIGLGGTFVVSRGKSKIHVMPEFSTVPVKTEEEVNNWIKFFEAKSPFTAFGCLITNGPAELDIRPIHFHGVNRESEEGGHFHIDTEPEDVEYLGYLTFAKEFIRFDQPK